MSRAKTERLLNLVICLLATRRYLSRDEIRRAVPGYPDSDEAFERAFERDKDELREMGIPIETGTNDAWFEDELGYRIRSDAYALPEVQFTPDEMAVLALAAQAWQQASLAGAATTALRKLQAYGIETAEPTIVGIDPRVDTNEAAFVPLWRAVSSRYPVTFPYQRPGREAEQREVEPWGIVSWHGRWYLVGHDRVRGDTRVFRLSRVSGEVVPAGEPGEVVVPDGVDLREEVARMVPQAPQGSAVVRLRAGGGGFLRRQAMSTRPDTDRPGWDLVEVPFSDPELLADAVCALGAAAVVVDPPPVRDAVLTRLRAAAGVLR